MKNSIYRQICCKDCGCGDDIFAMKPACDTPPSCYNGNNCAEVFSTNCLIYGGDSIADLGIIKGAKLTDVLQLIINAITNPGCTFPTSLCLSVVGFGSTSISSSGASFVWTPLSGAVSYQLEYKLIASPTWTVNAPTTNPYDSLAGLTPNTQYYVRVSTNCGANSCYSLQLLITTKSN